MFDRYPPKSIVVGVDGSQAAIRAARWAVDEAAGTDIPLRLLYVTKANPSASPDQARAALMAAEEVVHDAYLAIDEMGKPLKVETEVLHGHPVPTLIAASRSTTLLCVGDTGAAQHPNSWLGSTAKELAQSGHCSVAIVRGDRHDTGAMGGGWIVALVDESPDGIDVLELAIHEGRHRRAPLRVLTAAQSRSGDIQKDRGPVTGDSHLKRCMHNYPEVEMDTVVWKARSSTISSNMPRPSSWSWSVLPGRAKYSSSSAPLALSPCVTVISPCSSSVFNGRAANT